MYLADATPDYSSVLPAGKTPEQALIAGDITSAEFTAIKNNQPLPSFVPMAPGETPAGGYNLPSPPTTPEQKLKAGLITPAQFTALKQGIPSPVSAADIFNVKIVNPALEAVATPIENVISSINPFAGITAKIRSYGTYIVIGLAALGGLAIFSKVRK
jgi:hypothetical protein